MGKASMIKLTFFSLSLSQETNTQFQVWAIVIQHRLETKYKSANVQDKHDISFLEDEKKEKENTIDIQNKRQNKPCYIQNAISGCNRRSNWSTSRDPCSEESLFIIYKSYCFLSSSLLLVFLFLLLLLLLYDYHVILIIILIIFIFVIIVNNVIDIVHITVNFVKWLLSPLIQLLMLLLTLITIIFTFIALLFSLYHYCYNRDYNH